MVDLEQQRFTENVISFMLLRNIQGQIENVKLHVIDMI